MESIRNNLELSDRCTELIRQIEADPTLDSQAAAAARFSLRQAIRESNMPNPNRWTLVDHLEDSAVNLSGTAYENIARVLTEAANRLNAE
jgi:hypothetical protein